MTNTLGEDYHITYYSCMKTHMRNRLRPLLAPTEPNLKTRSRRRQMIRFYLRGQIGLSLTHTLQEQRHRTNKLCSSFQFCGEGEVHHHHHHHLLLLQLLPAPEASPSVTSGIRMKR